MVLHRFFLRGCETVNGAEISGIEEQTLSVHIDLPEGFTKLSFDDEIDVGRKLDKANILLKTGFDNIDTRFENLNKDLNTGFNEIMIGINNLSTIMLEQNTRLDEHNIRLEAILEKLANKS